jgi:protein phosphatase
VGKGYAYRTPPRIEEMQGPPTLKSVGLTDVGRRRQTNQDSLQCDDELGFWAVADGMGGHAAGEVASRETIDTIYGMVKRDKEKFRLGPRLTEETSPIAVRMVEGAVQAATYLVFGMAEFDAEKAGMGTTISALVSFGQHAVFAQVGDSRIYQVRDGAVAQLTEDHTLINWQLKQGMISATEALTSRHKNVITRAVGSKEYVQVDTGVVELQSGDCYLLCSDGLHTYLQPDHIVALAERDPSEAVQNLIDFANEQGGKDNITAILVKVI